MSIIAQSIASIGHRFGASAMASVGYRAPETNTGKSGYWRLFFTQMQEEALKQYEAKTGKSVAPVVAESTKAGILPKRKPKRKLEPLVPLEHYELPKFNRVPTNESKITVDEALPGWLLSVDVELQTMYSQFAPLIEQRRVKIDAQIAAANDADYRRRLLLLLAA